MDLRDRNKSEEAWVKHLEFIQNAITRMASNSFWLKGWTITLVAATFALNITTPSGFLILIALIPVIAFWGLDAYFLRQERLFRRLYDDVRLNPDRVDMSMNHSGFQSEVKTVKEICKSVSLSGFYGALAGLVVLTAGLRFLFTILV